jgi:hypothetical protein
MYLLVIKYVMFDVYVFWVLVFQFISAHTQICVKNCVDEGCVMSYAAKQLQLICSSYCEQFCESHLLACVC